MFNVYNIFWQEIRYNGDHQPLSMEIHKFAGCESKKITIPTNNKCLRIKKIGT